MSLSDKTLLYTPVRVVRTTAANSCRNPKRGLRYGLKNELDSNNECVGFAEFVAKSQAGYMTTRGSQLRPDADELVNALITRHRDGAG